MENNKSEKQIMSTPTKRKPGRPYKNPHLVPQGLADYIRDLKAQRDELLAALKDVRDNVIDDSPDMWQRVDAAIAKAETH